MSIAIVKNNMFQAYSSCVTLENSLSQLISTLNVVKDSNAYIVSKNVSALNYTMDAVKRSFERMLQANKVELHIFFSEFNRKNSDMIRQLDTLSDELSELSSMATELYELYKLSESMEFFLKYFISANDLRSYRTNISRVKNELQLFKQMIDTHNRKLRVGVRQ